MNFQTTQQTQIHTQMSGGIRFAIHQIGDGELAYYRLTADTGKVNDYPTAKAALQGIEDYMNGRCIANDRRKIKENKLRLW